MTKRLIPDLSKLLTATASPMSDATEPLATNDTSPTTASVAELRAKPHPVTRKASGNETATGNLENLNFKVPKSFRKRFRDCAYKADLKHNELLFAALDAWERLNSGKN